MFSNSYQLGSLDPSGAAATWRARLSKNKKNLYTSASTAAEYRFQGNQPKIQNAYNYKKRVVTGIRGAAFDQQTDDKYWQSKQIQPTINRPLGSGIRQAMLINEGVYNINPIAGTNAFGGGVVSRASGLNPTNYSISTSDDIEDRLRAHAVPANDPLSAEFAKNLPQGQKLDPGNVEGDAMLNTFANDNSIARNAKTQVWDSNLFPSGEDIGPVEEGIANPFGNGLNTSLEYIRKASISRINDDVGNKSTSAILANYRNAFRRNYTARLQDLGFLNQAVNPVGGLGVGAQDRIYGGGDRGGGYGGGGGNGGGGGKRTSGVENAFQNLDMDNKSSNDVATYTRGQQTPQKLALYLANGTPASYNSTSTPLYDFSNNDDDTIFGDQVRQQYTAVGQMFIDGMYGAYDYVRGMTRGREELDAGSVSPDYYGDQNTFTTPPRRERSLDEVFSGTSSMSSSSSGTPYDTSNVFGDSFDSDPSPGGGLAARVRGSPRYSTARDDSYESPAGGLASKVRGSPGYYPIRDNSFDLLPNEFKNMLMSNDPLEEQIARGFIHLQEQYGSREAYRMVAERANQQIANKRQLAEDAAEMDRRAQTGIASIEPIKGQMMGLLSQIQKRDVYTGHENVRRDIPLLANAAESSNMGTPTGQVLTNSTQIFLKQARDFRAALTNNTLLRELPPVPIAKISADINATKPPVVQPSVAETLAIINESLMRHRRPINQSSAIREAEGISGNLGFNINSFEASVNRVTGNVKSTKEASENTTVNKIQNSLYKNTGASESTLPNTVVASNNALTKEVGMAMSRSELNDQSGLSIASSSAMTLFEDPKTMARRPLSFSKSTSAIAQPTNNLQANQNTSFMAMTGGGGTSNGTVLKIAETLTSVRDTAINNGVQISNSRVAPMSPMVAWNEANERTIIALTSQLSNELYKLNDSIPTVLAESVRQSRVSGMPMAEAQIVDTVIDQRAYGILQTIYPLVHAIAFSPNPQVRYAEVEKIILAVEAKNADSRLKLNVSIASSGRPAFVKTGSKSGKAIKLPTVELSVADTGQIGSFAVADIASSIGLKVSNKKAKYTYTQDELKTSLTSGTDYARIPSVQKN